MTSINHDDSYPRSDAWADLGGGTYTYYREGTLRGKSEKPTSRRAGSVRPVDPDAQVLGSRADVTAPREQLDNNLRHIREIRAAGIVGDATVAEHVEVVPEQQQLFEDIQ